MAQEYWTSQKSFNTSNNLYSVKAVDTNIVWTCGSSGMVLRTIDGGLNWDLRNTPNDSLICSSIEAISADTAWVVADNLEGGRAVLYKTTDGGINWIAKQSSNEAGSFYNAVKFYNKNDGIFYGDPENGYFAIYTSNNGGETWIRTDSSKIPKPGNNEYGVANNLAILGNKAWFGTMTAEEPRIFYSNDRGKTWSAVPIKGGQSIVTSIAFSSELDGILLCNNNIGRTYDGGLTWNLSQLTGLGGEGLCYANPSSIIVVGYSETFVSTDKGTTWNVQSNNTSTLDAVSFADSSIGWSVGAGIILKWIGGSLPDHLISSIIKTQNNIPSNFELKQNYPNPFNPVTTINYSIPKEENVVLKLFDNLGREIKTLLNEYKNAGSYSIEFNASNLPSGVYYYQIQAGNFLKTRKLILIK